MSEVLTLVILYDDMITDEVPVHSRSYAQTIIDIEGDSVFSWYIKEDLEVIDD